MKSCLFLLGFACIAAFVSAQNPKFDKDFETAKSKLGNMTYGQAEKYFTKFVKKYPEEGDGWSILINIQHYLYTKSDESSTGFTITTTDGNGNTIEDSELAASLAELLGSSPKTRAKRKLLYTCRKATAYSVDAFTASVMLRQLLVDEEVDTNIASDAEEFFLDAENEFLNENYSRAIAYYSKALEIDSNYFKAYLYLGDTYYAQEDYAQAIVYFKEAKKRFPQLIEPRKFLIDALLNTSAYEAALKEVKEALLIYPDLILFYRMNACSQGLGLSMELAKVERGVVPNETEMDYEADEKGFHRKPNAKSVWYYYQQAYKEARNKADADGILAEGNGLTTSVYAEVYAWEEMLKVAPAEQFKTARKMQEKGYLDCYVLISNFHQDNYEQYLHLVKNNRAKAEAFFDLVVF